jgi:hypothetical protein
LTPNSVRKVREPYDDRSSSYAGHDELVWIANVTPEEKPGESLMIRSTPQHLARKRVCSPALGLQLSAQALPVGHRLGQSICNSANFKLGSIGSRCLR